MPLRFGHVACPTMPQQAALCVGMHWYTTTKPPFALLCALAPHPSHPHSPLAPLSQPHPFDSVLFRPRPGAYTTHTSLQQATTRCGHSPTWWPSGRPRRGCRTPSAMPLWTLLRIGTPTQMWMVRTRHVMAVVVMLCGVCVCMCVCVYRRETWHPQPHVSPSAVQTATVLDGNRR